jgi:hypothetical protein
MGACPGGGGQPEMTGARQLITHSDRSTPPVSTDDPQPPTRLSAMPGKLAPAHARPHWAARHKVLTFLGSLAAAIVIGGTAGTLLGAGKAGSRPAGSAGAVSAGSGSPAGATSAAATQAPSPAPSASSPGPSASPSPSARSATSPSAAASLLAPGRSGKAHQKHRPSSTGPLRSSGGADRRQPGLPERLRQGDSGVAGGRQLPSSPVPSQQQDLGGMAIRLQVRRGCCG